MTILAACSTDRDVTVGAIPAHGTVTAARDGAGATQGDGTAGSADGQVAESAYTTQTHSDVSNGIHHVQKQQDCTVAHIRTVVLGVAAITRSRKLTAPRYATGGTRGLNITQNYNCEEGTSERENQEEKPHVAHTRAHLIAAGSVPLRRSCACAHARGGAHTIDTAAADGGSTE